MHRSPTAIVLALILLCAPAAAQEPDPKDRIAAAEDRIESVLETWEKAEEAGQDKPVELLLSAMAALGKIPRKSAIESLEAFLSHKDEEVARCAARAMVAGEDEMVLLFAGSRLARKLTSRHYLPERRELFIDEVYALAATGYLGAFDQLCAMLRKVRDGEVVALAGETLAHLKDYRAIHVLEDWLSYDQGSRDGPGTGLDRGRRRAAAVGARPSTNLGGTPLPGTNRRNIAEGAWSSPAEKWVRDAVYESFFELVGREGQGFDSYDEYLRFMIAHRKEFKEKARATAIRAKEQENRIRACP